MQFIKDTWCAIVVHLMYNINIELRAAIIWFFYACNKYIKYIFILLIKLAHIRYNETSLDRFLNYLDGLKCIYCRFRVIPSIRAHQNQQTDLHVLIVIKKKMLLFSFQT